MVTNIDNTIHGFKRLLGRSYNDPAVQQELRDLPYKVVKQNNGSIGIKVNFLGEQHIFTPEQITAMFFTKLKETSEVALKTKVNDCVISVSCNGFYVIFILSFLFNFLYKVEFQFLDN